MGIKLSELLEGSLRYGFLEGKVISEIKRLEALEEPDDNTDTEPEPPKDIDVRELIDTGWDGGIEWVGYIPATGRFVKGDEVMYMSTMYMSTPQIHSATRHFSRINAKGMCDAYNRHTSDESIPWPMPKR